MFDMFAQIEAMSRVTKARLSLEECRRAGTDFPSAKRHWEHFLVSFSGIPSFLEQATKGHSKLTQWFGRVRKDRRDDDLLRYMHQARNASEHGTKQVVQITRTTTFNSPGGGTVEVQEGPDGQPQYSIRTNSGRPPVVERGPEKLVLNTVENRGVSYVPPKTHEGRDIADLDLIGMGELALAYYDAAVKEAIRIANGK